LFVQRWEHLIKRLLLNFGLWFVTLMLTLSVTVSLIGLEDTMILSLLVTGLIFLVVSANGLFMVWVKRTLDHHDHPAQPEEIVSSTQAKAHVSERKWTRKGQRGITESITPEGVRENPLTSLQDLFNDGQLDPTNKDQG
jgi:hypothetical protein